MSAPIPDSVKTRKRYISLTDLSAGLIILSLPLQFWDLFTSLMVAALGTLLCALMTAQVKNLGWQETADELLVTRGKIWHTFTVVPYGRIQFVDVTAGPVERAMGLKKVKLHTASPSSDATIPGLPAVDADALRERLAIKARERMSGL